MAKIKRTGLDYMPIDARITTNRALHRLMMKEGGDVLAVYIMITGVIYAEEGYYVRENEKLEQDIACNMITVDCARAHHLIDLLTEEGFFDDGMRKRYGILTSAEVQRQYLFIVRRRRNLEFIREYLLVDPAKFVVAAKAAEKSAPPYTLVSVEQTALTLQPVPQPTSANNTTSAAQRTPANVAQPIPVAVAPKPAQQTADAESDKPVLQHVAANGAESIAKHSKAKQSIAKHSKENILPPLPPEQEGSRKERGDFSSMTTMAGAGTANNKREGQGTGGPNGRRAYVQRMAEAAQVPYNITQADIDALEPPERDDDRPRNLRSLKFELKRWGMTPLCQFVVVVNSDFGRCDHPVFKAIAQVSANPEKYTSPAGFIFAHCRKHLQGYERLEYKSA